MEDSAALGRTKTATSVISRNVNPGKETAFEEWVHGISREAAKFPGHHSVVIFRPPPGAQEYTIVLHFDREEQLKTWLESEVRKEWIERSLPLTEAPETCAEVSGIEHWFALPGRLAESRPSKLKMAILTAATVYPTILGLNAILSPILRRIPNFLGALVVTVCMTFLLTYVLMPGVTRLFKPWLYVSQLR